MTNRHALLPEQVNIQAYLLWEKAGRPDGADFATDARSTLQAQLAAGKSLQELERALKEPEPQACTHTTDISRNTCLPLEELDCMGHGCCYNGRNNMS